MKLELKEYPGSWVIHYGKVYTFDIAMDTFPDQRMRTIRVYLPGIYDGVRRFPVLYLHDAQNLFVGAGVDEFKWYVDREMEKLPADLQVIVVGIDTSDDRGSELFPPYEPNPEHRIPRMPGAPEPTPLGGCYADFVVKTLKPIIDENFMTLTDPANTGVGGASMGGLQSFYMTLKNPEIFGRALLFSPGYAILKGDCLTLLDGYDLKRLKDVRFYQFSGGQHLDEGILPQALNMYHKLKELGFDYQQSALVIDTRESHYMTAWSKYFGDAVRYLFSADNSRPQPPMHTQRFPEPEQEK